MAAELGQLLSERSGFRMEQLDSTFVECGFDSLLLMQIGVELGKRYGVTVSLRDLMTNYNTIDRLAKHVVAAASPESMLHLKTATVAPPRPAGVRLIDASSAQVAKASCANQPASTLDSGANAAVRAKLIAIRDFIDL